VSAVARLDDLEERLGVTFTNRALLEQALTHSSYLNENPGYAPASNERLEFLGDAVLNLVVGEDMYSALPELDEGDLTRLRTHVVRGETLGDAGSQLGLGEFLNLGRGEEAGGGRSRPTNLAHACEAIVGAIYLDQGLEAARAFVQRSLADALEAAFSQALPLDPKSRLQEISQSRFQTTPTYHTIKSEGPDHARRFTVEVRIGGRSLGVGSGRSKQLAEKEAARRALQSLDAPPEREAGRDA